MSQIAWVLEGEIFGDSHRALHDAVTAAGQEAIVWKDEWWDTGRWPALQGRAVVFHGSLGNASRVAGELPWRPGAFCDTEGFRCSAWYPRAKEWLLHDQWRLLPAADLASDPEAALEPLGKPEAFFVRPDSPLKPFSGRVLRRDAVSLKALDFGFYFDDPRLPVIIAPVRTIGQEWRLVVVGGKVVAGCAYQAEGRTAAGSIEEGPRRFAQSIAERLVPPQPVYVMDLCETGGELRLVELNPFSGADLYGCDRAAIVAAVSRWMADRPK